MATQRRYIKSGHFYEICFRAKEGLPLPPTRVMNLLIKSAIARAQRDHKVHLCHHTWMGNHAHLGVVAKDADACKNFYGEVQKKLTESIKRLLGLEKLNIWEGTPTVAEIGDLDVAVRHISYWLANPAAANLVDTIEHYPGINTSSELHHLGIDSKVEQAVCWVRDKTVTPLVSLSLTEQQDRFIEQKLKDANKKNLHTLTLEPNYWMKCFGISAEKDIQELNEQIVKRLKVLEQNARELRIANNIPIIGRHRLLAQPIMKAHVPKKHERKIFVLCSVKGLRISLIKQYQEFCLLCRERYQEWKKGIFDNAWPPGAFRPPLPVQANAV